MIQSRKANNLILIENGQIFSYELDDKNCWEIGRPSKDNIPDIKLRSTTISRKHGKFQNFNGVWFYIDNYGKNGTIRNHKHLTEGFKRKSKAIMLEDGDIFIFGGGEEEIINCKTVWGMFTTVTFDEDWRIIDSKGYKKLEFITADGNVMVDDPKKGYVLKKETGLAIYMNELTYLIGDIEVMCH